MRLTTWYEGKQKTLGEEFLRELDRCPNAIIKQPDLHPTVYRNVRKRKLNRFPFLVFYTAANQYVSIVAVFHGSRKPGVWKERVKK